MGFLSIYVLIVMGVITIKLFEGKNLRENLIICIGFIAPIVLQSAYIIFKDWGF